MTANDRRTKLTPQRDRYGLKFIRMIIASYCIGIGVGLIDGFDPGIVFRPFFDPEMAGLIGASVVLYCAVLLFLGLFLRLTSLYLAVIVLFSSISATFLAEAGVPVDAFWRDLVIASALLLNYWTLNERAQGRQSIFGRRKGARHVPQAVKGKVVPVRILPKSKRRTVLGTITASAPAVTNRLPVGSMMAKSEIASDADRLFAKFSAEQQDYRGDDIKNVFV